ncbi:hypothetical protein [Nocardioides piscis]|uniref:Uncharacterized protein n=1 Tax=Nocardioides piscis TaxID=2714938 RepID=A0A6G7YJE4_9ACTN|nr:hypothetical protein [Nocardioides piscis]QIK76871.1 hypothetical protein G7071_16970 [Nocardioides piscis]
MSGTSDSDPTGEEPGQDSRAAQDEQWRAIVANYGDRVEPEPSPAEPDPEELVVPEPEPRIELAAAHDEQRFVPPPPPPLPRPAPRRAVAWAGLFGVPVIVLLTLVMQVDLPELIDYAFLVWFVGGFGYLVATMPPSPREPWDDGSRV